MKRLISVAITRKTLWGLAAVVALVGLASAPGAAWAGTSSPDSLAQTPPSPSPMRLQFFSDTTSVPSRGRKDLEPRTGGWWNRHRSFFNSWATYNRVDGIALYTGARRPLARQGYLPAFHAHIGYGFAAKRGRYDLGFEQPLAPRHKITLGLNAYRRVRSFFYGDEIIGSGENSASAFLLRRDYRNWYEAEGGRAFLGAYPSPFFSVTAGVTSRDERSLVNHTNWSVFRPGNRFRSNPPITEGTFRAFNVAAVYDSRPRRGKNHSGKLRARSAWGGLEHYHRLQWERAGAGLGGDFDLWRLTADLRSYLRLSPRQSLAVRLLAGTGHSHAGTLPPQSRFAIGGLSTLRGHSFRSLVGDHVALLNLQYAFDVSHRSQALVLVDSGTAWDRGSLTDQRIPIDVGAGFRLGDKGVTLLVGKTVNQSGAEAKVFLRFQEAF